MKRAILTILAVAAIGAFVMLVAPREATCFGCAEVPCFRGGPECVGQCSCQWEDEIHGFCG